MTLPLVRARDWPTLADAVIDHLTDLWHRQPAGLRPRRLELDVGADLGAILEASPNDPHLARLCRWLEVQGIRYRIAWGYLRENRLRIIWN